MCDTQAPFNYKANEDYSWMDSLFETFPKMYFLERHHTVRKVTMKSEDTSFSLSKNDKMTEERFELLFFSFRGFLDSFTSIAWDISNPLKRDAPMLWIKTVPLSPASADSYHKGN